MYVIYCYLQWWSLRRRTPSYMDSQWKEKKPLDGGGRLPLPLVVTERKYGPLTLVVTEKKYSLLTLAVNERKCAPLPWWSLRGSISLTLVVSQRNTVIYISVGEVKNTFLHWWSVKERILSYIGDQLDSKLSHTLVPEEDCIYQWEEEWPLHWFSWQKGPSNVGQREKDCPLNYWSLRTDIS